MGTGTAFQNYVKEFSNLDKATQQAILSSGLLSKAQKEQLISQMELSASTATLTAEQVQERLATELNSEADAKALLAKSGLITEKELETGTTVEITTAKLNEAVANGTLSASDAAVIAGALGITGANTTATTSFSLLTKAVWANVKAMGAWLLTTPAGWATLAIGAIAGLTIAYQKATLTIDEATDALEESKSSYDSISGEVSQLTEELNECHSRMKELQDLGSLRSVVEDDELSKLQETNVELTRRLAILKEEQRLKAVDIAKDASNVMTTDVESQYSTIAIGGSDERGQKVKPEEEMHLAIEAYREYAKEKAKIDAELLKDPENTELANESQKWQDKMDLAASRANEMAGYINQTEEAYKKVIDTGGTLTNTQTDLYNSSIALGNEYLAFTKEINGVNEAFENLDTTEKAQTLKDRYAKKTLSLPNGQGTYTVEDKEISDWIGTLPDEDLKILGTINFSGEQTKNSMQEALDYAKTHTDTTVDEMSALSPTITSSISQIATQLEPQFEKLGEAYKSIFTDDGFTLDDVDNSMLEGLRKSFAEIEKEVGVAFDATKLNSFFDALTNGNSSAEQVQQAFNDLATAYFYSTDTLAQLNEETADSIAKQLEELGVVNAKEVVYDTLNAKTEALALQEQLLAAQSDAVSRGANFNVESFLNQAGASEIARTYLFQLITAEQVFNNQDLNTADKIAKLKELATAYGQTAIAARIANLEKANEDGHVPIDYDKELASLQNDINNAVNNVKIDFKGIDTSGASKAGGDAGDAYVEAFEEELADLQDLRDRGVIDEAEYLNRLRELYTRYFADRKEYLDEYNKYERQYLEGMKSLYDSALSGISKLLSNKIDAVQEEKDATISALEEERDARLEVIEAQKEQLQAEIDLIDEQIDAKQEIIDGIQDEIDKMREANEERKRAIDLQKAQYELERMQNQRTILQYSEEKGMHYVQDTSGIRDAKQAVDDAQLEIDIAAKEKEISLIEDEIDLLEKQKDAINDQIDALDKQAEEIEKYYDKLIKEQEKMFDSMIKNLENQKSKWEELADIQEIAEAYSAIEQVFGELGYSVEDVLNGSEGAFEDFKTKYLAIISDMNQNTSFQEGLEYASGVAKESFGSIVNDSKGVKDALTEIGKASTDLEPVADAIGSVGTASSNASTSTSQVATNMGTLNTNTTGLSDNLDGINNSLNSVPDVSATVSGIAKSYEELGKSLSNGEDGTEIDTKLNDINTELTEIPADASTKIGSIATEYGKLDASIQNEDGTGLSDELVDINDALTNLPESSKFDAMATAFTNLGLAIKSVATALGVGEEGTVGGLVGALQEISSMSLDGASTGGANGGQGQGSGKGNTGGGIISQFNALKDAVDAVTSAIGGGGEGGSGGEGTGGEGESGGSGGLINAINEFKSATDEALGGGGESGEGGSSKGGQGGSSEGGSSGAIPQFEQLKTAVDDVTASIGTGEEEGGSGEGDASTLTGAITALGEKTTEVVGSTDEEETINGRFQQMSDVLGEADAHVTGISDGLDAIDGKEVECTITVNIKTNGSTSFSGSAQVLGSMNLESAEYKAQFGNAHYEGTAKLTGDWGVRQGGRTLVGEKGRELVVRGSHFFTVGDNGAEFVDLQPHDIVFNHIQTAELLKNGHISSRGQALANGTVNDGTIVTSNGTVFRPLQPGDKDYELFKKFQDYQEKFKAQIIPPVNTIQKEVETISRSINNVNTRNTEQLIQFSTGDIIVQGVQNVDGFAKAVKTHFPNAMIQALNTSR